MAIPNLGFGVTQVDINQRLGSIIFDLRGAFERLDHAKTRLDAIANADLVGLGFKTAPDSPDEVAFLRSALSDLADLRAIYLGDLALPVARDFTAFTKQFTSVI